MWSFKLVFILVLVIAFPIAWFISEFQNRRWLRILLGVPAILMSFGAAFLAGSLQMFNANAWYGHATEKLIGTTIAEIEAGNTDCVLTELKHLQQEYNPTYENRARYDVLVNEAVERMKTEENLVQPADE